MRKESNRALTLVMIYSGAVIALPVAASAEPESAGAARPAADNTAGIEEIVVTAQRRSESVQKSSVPISVLSADTLAQSGVTQPQDLNTVTPGLQLGLAGPTAQPYIRGVGNADNTGFAVSGVAFNLDGAYLAQPSTYGASLFDLERVEVLKGPQGTLYGRNATGGAINILTKEPGSEFGGYVGLDVNNYGLARLDGAINVPLSSTLAIRGAFYVDERKGFFDDGTSDDRSKAGRVRIKWTPDDDLKLLVNFEYSHLGGEGPGGAFDVGTTYSVTHPWEGTSGPNSKPLIFSTNVSAPPRFDQDTYGFSSELDWKLGSFTFTLLPSYRNVKWSNVSYSQGFQLETDPNTYKETTLEGRIAYEDDKLKWVTGLYFFNQHQTVNFDVNFNVIQLSVDVPKLDTQSWAGFTQATFSVTDAFRVIGGVRYSHEFQDGYGQDLYTSPPVGLLAYNADVTSDRTDWKAGLEYDLTQFNMLYATASTGYKAGGWFPSPAGPFGGNTFKPEIVTAYEVGSRNQFLNRTLQVNLEGFYWKYRNKQETFTGIDGIGLIDNVTENAGQATSKGIDADVVWEPTRADRFSASAEYLDAIYNRFTYQSPIPSAGCANPSPGLVDCSGLQMSRAPRWTGQAGYDHKFDLGSAVGTIDVAGNGTFGATRWLAATYAPNMHAPSYREGNIFVTYTTPDTRWAATAYVRNLSNAAVPTNAYPSLIPGVSTVSLNPPRTYGVTVKYTF